MREHRKHLALHRLRIIVLPLVREGGGNIARRSSPLGVLLCIVVQCFREPPAHLSCEILFAHLALRLRATGGVGEPRRAAARASRDLLLLGAAPALASKYGGKRPPQCEGVRFVN